MSFQYFKKPWLVKVFIGSLALVVSLVIFNSSSAKQDKQDREDNKIPGQYIIVLKDNISPQENEDEANDIVRKHGLGLGNIYSHALKGFAASIPDAKLKDIKNDPRVQYVTEDRTVSIERKPSVDRTVTIKAQVTPTGINRVDAEQTATHTNKGTGVNVAIIDTGIDLTHPDLQANIVGGKNCAGGKNGYNDGNGHGTHVAGTVAALNNGIGVVGVAPEAKLWAVRVLNNAGSGTWSSVICGVDFVTSKAPANGGPIKVANMSLGGSGTSDNNCGNINNDPMHKAICRSRDAGVTYVVAAGNSAADSSTQVPAAYDDAVITVSALADSDGKSGGLGSATPYGPDDTFATFSNFGGVVDLGAPGVNILSTWKGGSYNTISGTSMASPHVAGAAALYIKTHPSALWAEVRDALKALGESVGFGHTDPSGVHQEPVLNALSL